MFNLMKNVAELVFKIKCERQPHHIHIPLKKTGPKFLMPTYVSKAERVPLPQMSKKDCQNG